MSDDIENLDADTLERAMRGAIDRATSRRS